MARLLRVLAASILALCILGCHARVGGLVRSPVVSDAPTDDLDGMWAYTAPGELPRIEVLGEATQDDGDPRLPLEHTDVAAVVRGHVAQVRVTQTFRNDRDHAIEVVYAFPLPENAAVDDMRMIIGDRSIDSEVQTRAEARQTFTVARAAGHTAALLEQERPNIFTQSVTNIPPGEAIDVELEYLQTLSQDGGVYEFVFPMVVGPRFIPGVTTGKKQGAGWAEDTDEVPDAVRITPPIMGKGQRSGHDVSLSIDVHAGAAIDEWIAPTHTVTGVATAEGFSARLADAQTLPNRDFVLRWQAADATTRATLFLGPRDTGDRGHFSLLIQPPALDLDATIGRREMIFVIDTSGSMNGAPLALAKQTLRESLSRLRPVDTFNVIRFAGSTGELFDAPRPANESNIVLAERFIDGLEAGGGTYMEDAVVAALRPNVARGVNRYVFFLTDGYVGGEAAIFRRASRLTKRAKTAGAHARVFALGIGAAPNRYLIAGLAVAGHGLALYVGNREHPRKVVERYFRLVDYPVLAQVSAKWGGLEVSEVYPGGIRGKPDLFASHALVLLGRYHGEVAGDVELKARVAGSGKRVTLPVTVVDSPHDDRILSTLWARQKIAEIDAAYWDDDLPEGDAIAQITELGLSYKLVTAYTSFVAVDDSRVVSDGDPERIVQPVEGPEDVDLEMAAPSEAIVADAPSGPHYEERVTVGGEMVREIIVEATPVNTNASAQVGLEYREARSMPVTSSTSRDFTAVIDLVPTASRDAAGISLAGTTGAESKYSVEGATLTNPAFGTVGATLVQEFVEEVEVLESGYEARYGGVSGAQISARRLSGTNYLRGEAGVRVTPRLAAPRLIGATDEALRVTEIDDLQAQIFATVSGPIMRDRLYFTLGIAPSGTRSTLNQSFFGDNEKFAEQTFKTGALNLSYVAGLDWSPNWRHHLRLTVQGGPQFERTSFRRPHIHEPNIFGANPTIDPLGGSSRVATGIVTDHFGTNLDHSTLVALGYEGRTFDDRLEFEANVSLSQFASQDAWRLDNPRLLDLPATQLQSSRGVDLRELLEADGALDLVPGVREACASEAGEGMACPIRTWLSGGIGEVDRDAARRLAATLDLTYWAGSHSTHQLGFGAAFGWNQRHARMRYSGANDPDFYDPDACGPGQVNGGEYCFDPATGEYTVDNEIRVNANRLIIVDADNPSAYLTRGFGRARHELGELRAIVDDRGQGARVDGYDETLSSLDSALYLQDRWVILPSLYVDAGLRWELQDLRDIYGKSRAVIGDSFAPRLGVFYDWSNRGISRLYANYGRYYQQLPLQLNSRVFGGLVNVGRSYDNNDCQAGTTYVGGVAHPRLGERSTPTEWCVDHPEFTTGLIPGAVVPRLRGQFNRQLQIGYEQEVIEDLVLGARWLHSQLGRAVEDISPNQGLDFILANPGVGVKDETIDRQRGECEDLQDRRNSIAPDDRDELATIGRELAHCEFLLAAYEAVDRSFARPRRTYDALTLSVRKRFAQNWMLVASYTYSRLRGNYDGYVDPVTGAINLGASTQYDVPELIVNSDGPLAGDIPHRLKLDGFYIFDLGAGGSLTFGTSLRMQSGWAISHRVDPTLARYRGTFANYLLPRGSGGRVKPNYQWNLSVAYSYPLPRALEIEIGARVLNVTNAKATLRVDEVYSHDRARPIAGGDLDDLRHAKVTQTASGDAAEPYGRQLVTPQRNFGVPTRFQQPISAQFELKLRF